ncbi:MAG: 4Fe-4S cluster-binding domain-containing protein [Chitinophagales bacterium]|nr:4Fe-4S cluster-binding domain-containing protein [Bacteroidota bacterium]MCB9044294.1 4Fe-4S cluster-binding domain-containing protein [Chitinophagales bacterium]
MSLLKNLRIKLQQNEQSRNLLQSAKILFAAKWREETGLRKLKPKVIQLPITYNCNSKCVMCNIWNMDYSNEMNVEEFANFLTDPLFSEVEIVGINGGEPTLVKNLHEFAEVIVAKLPKLKSLNIISHGFNQKQLFKQLELMYATCKTHNIHFHVSISLDGYGETHNTVRGLKVFKLTDGSIRTLQNEKNKYCDSLDVGCTVIRQNVDALSELVVYAERQNIPIKYRLGIENKRIESDILSDNFNLYHQKEKQSAKEFFHACYFSARSFYESFKYFAIYHQLAAPKTERLLGCNWKEKGITLDSRGDLYYCAVASDKIGSLRQDTGEAIFWNEQNLHYRQQIIEHTCKDCIHDYYGTPQLKHIWYFLKEHFNEKLYWLPYFIKTRTFF